MGPHLFDGLTTRFLTYGSRRDLGKFAVAIAALGVLAASPVVPEQAAAGKHKKRKHKKRKRKKRKRKKRKRKKRKRKKRKRKRRCGAPGRKCLCAQRCGAQTLCGKPVDCSTVERVPASPPVTCAVRAAV